MHEVIELAKTNKNLKAMRKIWKECFPHERVISVGLVKYRCWGIVVDGNLVAAAAGCKKRDGYYLSLCGVLEDYRGAGMQVSLIESRVNFAKEKGYRRIYTHVIYDNYPSKRNLEKMGFISRLQPNKFYELELVL